MSYPTLTCERTVACSGPAVVDQSLGELMQEVMQKHMSGIHFREWNAGSMLDEHMVSEGFDINIWVHREVREAWLASGF